MIATTSTSSCHRRTLLPICWWKKSLENAFLKLSGNYCKIVQKKQIISSKTTITWLFDNILCYLSFLVLGEKLAFFNKLLQGFFYTLKQSYIDLCAQSVNVNEFLFREYSSLTPSGLQNRLHFGFRCLKPTPQVKCH